MIGLTDTQLKIVMSAARSVPVEKREKIVRGREIRPPSQIRFYKSGTIRAP